MAEGLIISDAQRLRLVLEVFSCFDDIRWQDAGNYNPLNYSHHDLTPDEKILTHWLCYITDRQTAFQRVWDVGGYVISDLVRTYTRERHTDVRTILFRYVPEPGGRLWLECDLERANERLKRYGITGPRVRFVSRYMPEDLVLIYRTLRILDAISARSLPQYIARVIESDADHRRCIRRMAVALNDLTYSGGGALSADRFEAALSRADADVAGFRITSGEGAGLFGRKRLWCSLRDYLKSPDFNTEFVSGLSSAGVPNPEAWRRCHPALTGALAALELPGDVWNNAPVFRRGLFSPYLKHEPRAWDMPRTIRRVYEILTQDQPVRFYPEQMDVTFDFVPRMCDRQECGICPFGTGIREICHAQPGCLCSVALVTCGYRHRCAPSSCALREDRAKGLCHSSLATVGPDAS